MLYVKIGLALLAILFVAAILILPNMVVLHERDLLVRRESALQEFNKCAKEKPGDAEGWCRWGNALVDYGREETHAVMKKACFTDACQKAETATRCDAKFTEAWMVWGHALYNLSETETDPANKREALAEAIKKYAEAARLKPDHRNAWYNLGYMKRRLAALEKGGQNAAAPGDEQNKRLDPEHGDPMAIYVDCARVAMTQGDKAGCRAMLEQCKKELGTVDRKQLQAEPAFDSVRAEDWFKAL